MIQAKAETKYAIKEAERTKQEATEEKKRLLKEAEAARQAADTKAQLFSYAEHRRFIGISACFKPSFHKKLEYKKSTYMYCGI